MSIKKVLVDHDIIKHLNEIYTIENGNEIKELENELLFGLIEIDMNEILLMIKELENEFLF